MTIDDWRREIDAIDEELLRLMKRRARLALEIGALKRRTGLPLCDASREREVLERVLALNDELLDDEAVAEVFRRIIRESLRVQHESLEMLRPRNETVERFGMNIKMQEKTTHAQASNWFEASLKNTSTWRVAFQGERGAFSEEAAFKLLGAEIELVPCATFEELFAAIEAGKSDALLAPLENNLAGAVVRCHELLRASQLEIIGEVVLPIAQHLIGCQDAQFEDVRAVMSHPVALAQCEKFFAAYPQIEKIIADDTAGSVRRITADKDRTRAAIAGERAAQIYGGKILRAYVQDAAENHTRFVLLAPLEMNAMKTQEIQINTAN